MTNLERLAALLFDAIVNLDPQEFDAITAAASRFKAEAAQTQTCPEFATLFGAIERAVIVVEPAELPPPADLGTYLCAVTGRPERRDLQNQGRRLTDYGNRRIGTSI